MRNVDHLAEAEYRELRGAGGSPCAGTASTVHGARCGDNPDPRCWCCSPNRDSRHTCERCRAHGAWRGPLPEQARAWLAKEARRRG